MSIELRYPVQTFAEAMEIKLQKHDGVKGLRSWYDPSRNDVNQLVVREYIIGLLDEEVRRLRFGLNGDSVDIGNYAMMLYDLENAHDNSSTTN